VAAAGDMVRKERQGDPSTCLGRSSSHEQRYESLAASRAGSRCWPARRHRSDPPRPLPHGLPHDPDDRLALPPPVGLRLRARRRGTGDEEPPRCHLRRPVRALDARRLSVISVDRPVQFQGGIYDRRGRRRRDRGGHIRRARHGCVCPAGPRRWRAATGPLFCGAGACRRGLARRGCRSSVGRRGSSARNRPRHGGVDGC
jgi:hypothetical protein